MSMESFVEYKRYRCPQDDDSRSHHLRRAIEACQTASSAEASRVVFCLFIHVQSRSNDWSLFSLMDQHQVCRDHALDVQRVSILVIISVAISARCRRPPVRFRDHQTSVRGCLSISTYWRKRGSWPWRKVDYLLTWQV